MPGAERRAVGRQHDDAHRGIAGDLVQRGVQLGDGHAVERVALLRPVQRQGRDPVAILAQHARLVAGHSVSSRGLHLI